MFFCLPLTIIGQRVNHRFFLRKRHIAQYSSTYTLKYGIHQRSSLFFSSWESTYKYRSIAAAASCCGKESKKTHFLCEKGKPLFVSFTVLLLH